MRSRISVQKITLAALLIVISVAIPMYSPLKLVLGPATFTPAVHAPIFVAMFISPLLSLILAASTTLGFILGGASTVVVYRAASHVIFALAGAAYLRSRPQILSSALKTQVFSFAVGVVHAWLEATVVAFFYMDGDTGGTFYTSTTAFLLVGLGGLVHSMVDFAIALAVFKILSARRSLQPIFVTSKISK